jgi:hypothetical protein
LKFNDRNFKVTSCHLDANWGRQIFLDSHECNWEQLDALEIKPIPDENPCKQKFMSINYDLGWVNYHWKVFALYPKHFLRKNIELQHLS